MSTQTHVTGYEASKLVNEMLKIYNERNNTSFKSIPPQMIYNYKSKGYIPSVVINGKEMILVEALESWFNSYITKKLVKLSK